MIVKVVGQWSAPTPVDQMTEYRLTCALCPSLDISYKTVVEATLNAQRHRAEHMVDLATEIREGAR